MFLFVVALVVPVAVTVMLPVAFADLALVLVELVALGVVVEVLLFVVALGYLL